MQIKTYRAQTMHEALQLVRRELGPEAAVLHTREVRAGGLFRWLTGARQIEVTASQGMPVPSRLPARLQTGAAAPRRPAPSPGASELGAVVPTGGGAGLDLAGLDARSRLHGVSRSGPDMEALSESVSRLRHRSRTGELPEVLFEVFTNLIENDVREELARELIDRARGELSPTTLADANVVASCVARLIEDRIGVSGPIQVGPRERRQVALVGPTGVGKTTTIAKLAAHFRLRERLRVGLITVDTYRIAAVEQLRTYADIIDLPMEVVSTPREMREAVRRLHDMDLVLVDTAGRSPRDEVRIQELKSMLAEAGADEVHLVLSAVMGAAQLAATAERFAEVGVTHLLVTKLDEAAGLGNLLPLVDRARLPISYVTNGQNVPDAIAVADARRLAGAMLGFED